MVKHQIPCLPAGSKHQINSNDKIRIMSEGDFSYSELELRIYLGFVIWNLGFIADAIHC